MSIDTTVEMIRYGYPFARVRWVFNFAVPFANRTSDPCGEFLDGIVKHPEEVAVGANAMSWVVSANFIRLFVTFLVTQEES